jgi:hypothetical protein
MGFFYLIHNPHECPRGDARRNVSIWVLTRPWGLL